MDKSHFLILASAVDREKLRADWRARFENRSIANRTPAKLEIRAVAADTTEIMLYDEIGYWGVTAKDFTDQLNAIKTASITVRINSPGGDVMDGLAMYAALVAHPATITTQVDGWAASAASYIAMAGDTVTMAPNAFLMIHKAWSLAIGNADDMRATAGVLDKIDGQLALIYAKKTGKPAADIMEMMKAETWFTADEALEQGFITSITGPAPEDATGDKPNAEDMARMKAMRRRLALAEHD